jgi:hypothetical protein
MNRLQKRLSWLHANRLSALRIADYLHESQYDVHLIVRGRCGGADDGGAAAAQPNEWIPAPSITSSQYEENVPHGCY